MKSEDIFFLIWDCLNLVGPREIGGSKRNGPDRPVRSRLEQGTSRRNQIDSTARKKRKVVRHRGERIVFSGPNTNTNTIRFQKFGRIRIRILFGFRNMAEYEYEYYSGSEIWPNTNTNTIRSAKFVRIRIRILRLFE